MSSTPPSPDDGQRSPDPTPSGYPHTPAPSPWTATPGSEVAPWAGGAEGQQGYPGRQSHPGQPGYPGQQGYPGPQHPGPPPGYAGPPAPPPVVYKDTTVAYLLWFFLTPVGAHKFYLRQPGLAVTYIALTVLGWLTVWFLVGGLFFLALFVLFVVDACTMPDRVRRVNAEIHARALHGWR